LTKAIQDTFIATINWALWTFRNNHVFKDSPITPQQLSKHILNSIYTLCSRLTSYLHTISSPYTSHYNPNQLNSFTKAILKHSKLLQLQEGHITPTSCLIRRVNTITITTHHHPHSPTPSPSDTHLVGLRTQSIGLSGSVPLQPPPPLEDAP
jgi:hypothetical protein